jgi:DNA-directed RNA polymerase subunit RPC12/RpoP
MGIQITLNIGFDIVCVNCKAKLMVKGVTPNQYQQCPECGIKIVVVPAQKPLAIPQTGIAKNLGKFTPPAPAA